MDSIISMDKLTNSYARKRKLLRWPLKIEHYGRISTQSKLID